MENTHLEKATFAAGCFWGVEADFARIPGVVSTAVGYEGGILDNPTYHDVCYKATKHAEVVELEFDPAQVSFQQLVEAFWQLHDPTTLNRQGPDIGDQYRSAIFYHSPEQQQTAHESRAQAQAHFSRPIVTQITPAQTFWRAEEYHQRYLEKRGKLACDL